MLMPKSDQSNSKVVSMEKNGQSFTFKQSFFNFLEDSFIIAFETPEDEGAGFTDYYRACNIVAFMNSNPLLKDFDFANDYLKSNIAKLARIYDIVDDNAVDIKNDLIEEIQTLGECRPIDKIMPIIFEIAAFIDNFEEEEAAIEVLTEVVNNWRSFKSASSFLVYCANVTNESDKRLTHSAFDYIIAAIISGSRK